jgi:hypothetical protein
MMEQWAQKPDKTCEFYLRVVNNTYISFSDEKNSLLHKHNLITFCTSTPPGLDQRQPQKQEQLLAYSPT